MENNLLNISKSIAYFLRHNPQALNIKLDSDGWMDLNDFLKKLSDYHQISIDLNTLKEISKQSDKQRFEISSNKIRAVYGHSLTNIKISYPEITLPIALYHGTEKRNIENIKTDGLLPMNRNYVHFSDNKDMAIRVAKRHSKDIILLKLNTKKFIEDGNKIYKAGDGVYLTQKVSSEYLEIL